MFFKHFLVVSHWCLAWWTPSGPEIKKQNFTLLVINICSSIFHDFVSTCDLLKLTSNTQLGFNVNPKVRNISDSSLDFLVE